MTYKVWSGTLNLYSLTHSLQQLLQQQVGCHPQPVQTQILLTGNWEDVFKMTWACSVLWDIEPYVEFTFEPNTR